MHLRFSDNPNNYLNFLSYIKEAGIFASIAKTSRTTHKSLKEHKIDTIKQGTKLKFVATKLLCRFGRMFRFILSNINILKTLIFLVEPKIGMYARINLDELLFHSTSES